MTGPHTPPPETPPKGTSNKLIAAIVVIVVIAFVVPITLFLLLQPSEPTNGNGPPDEVPIGQFTQVHSITDTTATVEFGTLTPDTAPVWVKIVFSTDSLSGSYNFPSNSDGTTLTHHGVDIGTMVYRDYADDQVISSGDELLLSELSPSTDYTVKLVWVATGDLIDSIVFSTTA
ncbi:MAG: hypothetical protein JSV43_07820 [Methanobacteriota archaeon]|nr:MAG: hypothetical protein JSV43_07820 [Euryarchaeota archaeon]